jgi:hypothetical protein
VSFQDNLQSNSFVFEAIRNGHLYSLLINYTDSTRRYLGDQNITVHPSIVNDVPDDVSGYGEVITFGELNYWPYKQFLFRAKDAGINILEY